MSATIEETGCHLVAGEVVYRAQRHPYHLLLGILTQRDTELQALDLQGHIHQPLGIALDKAEALLILTTQRVEGRMALLVDYQTVAEHMTHHAQTVL